jgi:hypothetical protein
VRHPEATPGELADEVRAEAVRFARTNGALAGTPFLIALVPAFVSVLWEQARMAMKIAALHDRDPARPEFASEVLYLRGIYATPDAATRALSRLDAAPARARASPAMKLRSWIQLIYLILILAGFLPTPDVAEQRSASHRARFIRNSIAAAWLAVTWVVPITCMIAMSHSCAHDTQVLATRSIDYYRSDHAASQPGRRPARARAPLGGHALILVASLAIPLGLITLAVLDPIHHAHLVAISGFLGLGLVTAMWARAARA